MKIRLAFVALLCAGGLMAQVTPLTHITGTLTNSDSSNFTGQIFVSWPEYQIGSVTHQAGSMPVAVSDGVLDLRLAPTDQMKPAGVQYRVVLGANGKPSVIATWSVPTSASAVDISAIYAPGGGGGSGNATTVNGAAVPLRQQLLSSNASGQVIPGTPQSITYNAFGDSITYGNDAVGVCNGGALNFSCAYPSLVAYARGWTLNDQAVGGEVLADQMVPILASAVSTQDYSSLLIGQNESGSAGGAPGTGGYNQFYSAQLAAAVWLSIPSTNPSGNSSKVLAQASAAVKSGTWTNVSEYGGAMGLKSTTGGDSITVSLPGNTIYVAQLVRDSSNCQLDIAIDGIDSGNYSLSKVYTGGTGNLTYIAEAIRISGVNGPLQHSVVITDVDPGTSGCELLFFAGSGGHFQSGGPFAYLLAPYHTGQGQAYSLAKNLDSAVQTAAYELASDGLGVGYVDVAAYIDLEVNPALSPDTIHPNNAGHALIASAVLNRLNNLVTPKEQMASITPNPEFNSVTVGGGIFNPGTGYVATIGTPSGSSANPLKILCGGVQCVSVPAAGGLLVGINGAAPSVLLSNASGFPGIWFGANTSSPGTTNYSVLFDNTNTIFNSPSGNVYFRIGNGAVAGIHPTGFETIGLRVTGTATAPPCSVAGDVGNQWTDSTSATDTAIKFCVVASSVIGWKTATLF